LAQGATVVLEARFALPSDLLNMDKLSERITALAPEKRAILEQRLARRRDNRQAHRQETVEASLVCPPRPERIPLSYAQQRIWFLHRLQGSSAEYILSETIRLTGALDRQALAGALQAMVHRHESLRTHFIELDDEPFQVIEPNLSLSLAIEDLTHLEEHSKEQAIRSALQQEIEKPFDLTAGPLVRTKLFKLGEREHIFLVVFHHIISDGWSIAAFNEELGILYDALSNRRDNPLTPLSLQYGDYAVWQRSYLQGEELERLLTYWRSQLTDLAAAELPNDRPRPQRQIFDGDVQRIVLRQSLCEELRRLCNAEGATMAMAMLALLQLLLHRLTGDDDIAVGSAVAGRNHAEIEPLIGFFVNTLVLRTDFAGNPTFRQLLARVRKTALEAYSHQDAPFEKLVEILNPERTLNRHPFFEVFFNYVNLLHVRGPQIPGLSVEAVELGHVLAKFPMTLYIRDTFESIEVKLVYQTALFSSERITHFLDQLEWLAKQAAEDPDRPIESYSLVSVKARMLLPDPTISIGEPAQVPVTSRFLANAEANPSQIALRQEGRQWTYQDLAKSAKEVAGALIARGVAPGDVVAVSGQRSFGLIAGIMGALLARGVLLMLDSSLPSARRDFMLQAAAGKHWLSVEDANGPDGTWSEGFTSLPLTRLSPDGSLFDTPEQSAGSCDPTALCPEDPAYVFFTSGTTGVPKGIRGIHKGLSHFLQWEQQALSISSTDRVAQLTGLSFDVVLRDIFLPLSAGATLSLPDAEAAVQGADTIFWMKRERVTILHTVPSLAAAWLDSLESSAELPQLRWTLMAGEPLTDTLVSRWRDKVGTAHEILNLYGPTETTLAKCAYRIPVHPSPGVQPIGTPLPDTQTLVINKAHQLCGIGEPGEIVIRTPFRTLGYLNVVAESQSVFAPNPFRDDPHDLIYRTGDRGSYGNEGLLHISGRTDDQVKIRGNRVEPAEIAAILAHYPGTLECVVIAREDVYREKCLVAYLVRDVRRANISVVGVREFLKEKLPEYMIPAGFVVVDKLPLTPNGKLDRKALPSPDRAQLQAPDEYVAPRDPIERALAQLWSDLLKLDTIGVRDDFFALGGHSLIATRLVSQIRKEFDVEIPVRSIFESTTIERLALQIAERQTATMASEDVDQLLNDLELLPEDMAERQLLATDNASDKQALLERNDDPADGQFSCPDAPSRFFGLRTCNLVIVINERFEKNSFETLADYVREFDPKISTFVTRDRQPMDIPLLPNPTLTFSPALIRHLPPISGRVFCGYPFSKSEEYVALERAGIPVPRWTLLNEDHFPDLSEFDEHLIKKPDHGGRGAEVKIVRKNRVKWNSVTTRSAGTCSSFILQQFIYTGPRPVCYRVNTLFGNVLYAERYERVHNQPAWTGPEDTSFSGRSIVASSPANSKAELSYDEEVIRFGERAHCAFPDIPLLGFDIVREVPSGKLFVLEANAIGYVWTFHAISESAFGFSTEAQFNGLRKAAYILAEKTQECAE
jgi:amino acid adenylation domain-containing protein